MTGKTSIMVTRETKSELDNLKLTASETYNEVIVRLLEAVNVSSECGFELTNGLFKISCEADFETDRWYFLNELGDKSEINIPSQHFVDEGIQNEYETFVEAITEVSEADLNLLDYGAGLRVGDVHQFDGFTMKRIY
ncbi:hypothetical protein [uncultured Methanobrevibacter sp.]|uniref:hypothetical protein n=1 Tax=uncultured Methanobrevibacter sp. TaxID=253161 RepID=UPI002621F86A|nr:hypothetical protein [uncultured Methanobrevibacter sp.]